MRPFMVPLGLGQDRLIGGPTATPHRFHRGHGRSAVPRRTDRRGAAGRSGLCGSPSCWRGARNLCCCRVAQHHFLQGACRPSPLLASSWRKGSANSRSITAGARCRSSTVSNRGTTNNWVLTVFGRPGRLLSPAASLPADPRPYGNRESINCGRFARRIPVATLQHAKNREGLGGGRAPAGGWRQQGPAGLEFRQQPGDPLVFVHGAVGHG